MENTEFDIANYKVFSIRYDSSCSSHHELFVKPHDGDDKPLDRTLFVTNVPPWADVNSIKSFFSGGIGGGAVEVVDLLGKIKGFKSGFIVFERPSSVQSVMSHTTKKIYTWPKTGPVGMAKWRAEYNASILRDPESAKKEIETWVADFEASIEKGNAEAEPDSDGWITVSKSTSKRRPVAKVTSKLKAKEQRKRKRKELENFYRFQVKESKLRKLEELRAKFECDKQKQLQMKGDRKFRPT